MCICSRVFALKNIISKREGTMLNAPKQMSRLIRRCLSSKAKLYAWGSNDAGEMGTSQTKDTTSPFFLSNYDNFRSVSCGYGTSFLYNKKLRGAIGLGLNSLGQLGTENDKNEIDVAGDIIQISCGRAHTLLWSSNGVYATGSNVQGQCGLPRDYQSVKKFQPVSLPFDHSCIKQIACGLDHSLILTKDGKIYATGLGTDGQTGRGDYDCQYEIMQVSGSINDARISQISTSTDSCLALTDQNTIFGWGNNEQGQILRSSKEKQIANPTLINIFPENKTINKVIAGGSFSAFLSDGDVFVTGFGALGLGKDTTEAYTYEKVALDPIHGKVTKVSCGPDYLAALTERSKLLTWGRGNHGRLGHGDTDDQFTPKMVSLPGPVVGFSCGIDHMMALVDHDEKQ